jgi:TP901 family phage tail tape measure protein
MADDKIVKIYDLSAVGIDKILADIQKVNDALEKLKQAKNNVGNTATGKSSTKQDADDTAKLIAEKEKLKAKLKELQSEEAKEIAILKEKVRQSNNDNKLQAQLAAAQKGSLNNLRAELIILKKEWDNMGASAREALGGKNLAKNINDVDKQVRTLEESTGRFQRNVGNYPKTLSQLFSQVKDDFTGLDGHLSFTAGNFKKFALTASAAIAGISLFAIGSKAKDINLQFEESANELKAITGVMGKDFDYLKEKAIETSKASKFTAVDTLEAFKLIGSAKPELLQDVEALNKVKDAAVLLAQASGSTLPSAVQSLTAVLNQYGAGANEASKYTDALAAGAKYGAAEVPNITASLLEFGTQAKSSNISIYESVGAIELLAEKGVQGSEAGTKLRNVMLALNAAPGLDKKALASFEKLGIDTRVLINTALPLEVRLKELSKAQNDNVALLNIFGKENFNVGQIVLQNVDRYAELTKQVQATGIAQEQATTNSKSATAALAKLKNTFDALLISDAVSSAITAVATALTVVVANGPLTLAVLGSFITAFTYLAVANAIATESGILYQAVLVAQRIKEGLATAALVIKNGVMTAANVITSAYTAITLLAANATGIAAVGVRLLAGAFALLSSPVGIVIGVVAALVTVFGVLTANANTTQKAIDGFNNKLRESAAIQRNNAQLIDIVNQKTQETIGLINTKLAIAKNELISFAARKKAVEDIIAVDKENLKGLRLTNDGVLEGTEILQAYVLKLYDRAKAEAYVQLITEKNRKLLEIQAKKDAINANGGTKLTGSTGEFLTALGGAVGIGDGTGYQQYEKLNEEEQKTQDELKALQKTLEGNQKLQESIGNIGKGGTGTTAPKVIAPGTSSNTQSKKDKPAEINPIEVLKKEYEHKKALLEKNKTDEETFYNDLIILNKKYIGDRKTIAAKFKDDELKFNDELQKSNTDANIKIYDEKVKAFDREKLLAQEAAKDKLKLDNSDINATPLDKANNQIAFDESMLQIEKDYQQKLEDIKTLAAEKAKENTFKEGQEIKKIQSQIDDDKLTAARETSNAQLNKIDQEYIDRVRAIQSKLANDIAGATNSKDVTVAKDDATKALDDAKVIQIDAELLHYQNMVDAKLMSIADFNKKSDALENERQGIINKYNESEIAKAEEKEKKKADFIKNQLNQGAQLLEKAIMQQFELQEKQIDKDYDVHKSALDTEKEARLNQAQSAAEKQAIEAEYAAKQKEAERQKNIEHLEVQKKQLEVETALASMKAISAGLSNGGPAGAVIAEALVLAQYFISLQKLNAQKFAEGGMVQPYELSNGKIQVQSNTKALANGDNVIAYVKPGEVILNKMQQQLLGGPNTFASIGVPGFANGGYIGAQVQPPIFQSYYQSNSSSNNNYTQDISEMKSIVTGLAKIIASSDSKEVILNPHTVTSFQNKITKNINLASV